MNYWDQDYLKFYEKLPFRGEQLIPAKRVYEKQGYYISSYPLDHRDNQDIINEVKVYFS